ncbi:alginate lyase family protein [Paraglaciecola sp.]|uniref:alginate lyase family protein n=1 Tax=Paraglaciecola sp. TaxID=1920173 RepID=UPI003EF3E625
MPKISNRLISCSIGLFIALTGCSSTADPTNKKVRAENTRFISIDQAWLESSYADYKSGDPVLNQVVKNLLVKAEIGLKKDSVSVLDKSLTPPSGSKKDYISVGPYWWPDETKSDGLPWIKKDGQVNPSSKTNGSDKIVMNEMLFQISDLSLAYFYTKDKKYAKKASQLINTWFLDPTSGMNPSLHYGQAVPGQSDGRKYGVIETRWFIRLIDDVGLLSDSGALSSGQQTQFKNWLGEYLNWLLNNELGQGACDAHNNHGTYCEAQVAAYALFTGKNALAKKYTKRVFDTRLEQQVKPSGAQPDELARTRPLHYSLFNLEAYFFAARVGDHLGLDMWHYQSPNGSSLKSAIDFLLPAIKEQGYWQNVEDKKMRRGRLFYFLQVAYQKYADDKYLQAIEDLIPLVVKEDRAELAQCLLISPKPQSINLARLLKMDPDGSKSHYRCYY